MTNTQTYVLALLGVLLGDGADGQHLRAGSTAGLIPIMAPAVVAFIALMQANKAVETSSGREGRHSRAERDYRRHA